MKKGFTLAEVLITLAIIGIVAALTIPSLIVGYQKQQYYAAFMKGYNTTANLFQNILAQRGGPDFTSDNDIRAYLGENMPQFLNTAKICNKQDAPGCFAESYSFLKGSGEVEFDFKDYSGYLLTDGSSYIFSLEGGVFFDINGPKAPNVVGRDLFVFEVDKVHHVIKPTDWDNEDTNCDPDAVSSIGNTCSGRLFAEGKMSY